MKKSTHTKIKNTAILFELLSRQVAADALKGIEPSPALNIIKESFKANSALAKELVLYQTIINEKYNSTHKAEYLLSTIIKLRNKIDFKAIKEAKYALIREVKKHYNLVDFFKTKLSDYKLCASIYRIFEGASINKASEIVESKFTIVEHLTRKSHTKPGDLNSGVIKEYLNQDKEIRLLAYKLMIDKFNDKYSNLSTKQKNILKEYINNISNTTKLKDYVLKESKLLHSNIVNIINKVQDKVTIIKIKEACNLLERFEKIKSIKEEHILSLLLYHELLKELKNAK